jgi:hypothetical protein
MQTYNVIHKENNTTWLWNSNDLLMVINSDRSDHWTNYNIKDLKNNHAEVCAWLPELEIKEQK